MILFSPPLPLSSFLFVRIFVLLDTAMADGGRALAFKPDNPEQLLVGTEEGNIHLCTTEFACQYLNRQYQLYCRCVDELS